MKMAASRVAHTTTAGRKRSLRADSLRLAPASPKNATLESDMICCSMECNSSLSSGRSWRRLVTTIPIVTHASSGSASKRCAMTNTAVDNRTSTTIRALFAASAALLPVPNAAGIQRCRKTMLSATPPHAPTAIASATLMTGSSTLISDSPTLLLAGRMSVRISSMLSANATMTKTSLTTTTAITSDVNGPRASSSRTTAIADAGDRVIISVAPRLAVATRWLGSCCGRPLNATSNQSSVV
mmetsp:Transcript_30100/g.89280  ORF Transcript_30100/g.89280 Transcript_30100/m.89280 type:complete len:241 (+) Transcript_30100:1227-1949(+)